MYCTGKWYIDIHLHYYTVNSNQRECGDIELGGRMIQNMVLGGGGSGFKTAIPTRISSNRTQLFFDNFFNKERSLPDEYLLLYLPSSSATLSSYIDHILKSQNYARYGSGTDQGSSPNYYPVYNVFDIRQVLSRDGDALCITNNSTSGFGFHTDYATYILYYRCN